MATRILEFGSVTPPRSRLETQLGGARASRRRVLQAPRRARDRKAARSVEVPVLPPVCNLESRGGIGEPEPPQRTHPNTFSPLRRLPLLIQEERSTDGATLVSSISTSLEKRDAGS